MHIHLYQIIIDIIISLFRYFAIFEYFNILVFLYLNIVKY